MDFHTKTEIFKKLSTQKLTESQSIEFKSEWNKKHGKSLSSIGNTTHGGYLIIGVSDRGLLLDNKTGWIKKQYNLIESHINQYLEPHSVVQSISIEAIDDKQLILIEIINPRTVVSWNGKFYKRVGARTQEMEPGEKQQLAVDRPGLDFSGFPYKGSINSALVLDFAKFLKNGKEDWIKLSADNVLSKLNIKNKNTAGVLFGEFSFRVAHYNQESELTDQYEKESLYHLLKEDFIQHIQSWTRTKGISLKPGSLSITEEKPYPPSVLREVLVNAIAHSAFEKQEREITVELYKNRIRITNHCSATATAFINKKFHQRHFSYNPFLMKILRKASFSDELGTGKNKIFKLMIESGRREPLFEYQEISKDYGKWSVTLYNEQPNKNLLKLFKKLKQLYKNNIDKYKLSMALILWRDKTMKEIDSYIDEYHKKLITEILLDNKSPFLVTDKPDKSLLLKRWVQVQLSGQESKAFSKAEEHTFKEIIKKYAFKENREGYITNKEARQLFGLSNSQSEIVQLSKVFQRWEKTGFIKKAQRRRYWKIQKN